MNRRNVLTGLGGLAISGGALFGTGAFTSVSAERAVEVNVLGGQNGLVGGNTTDEDQKAIADSITEGAVDVLVDLSSDSIAVRTDSGLVTDGSELYPSPNTADTVYSSDPSLSDESQYVSLVANDVTIVFGSDVGLPRASDITYDDLFAFADPKNNDVDVNFATSSASDSPLLTGVGSNSTDLSGADNNVATVSNPSNGGTAKASVATGTKDGATERLDIGIGEDPTA
ncbi:hypothetical protein C435_14773 [Haloarcula marismortui ATCC 33799]|uniref:DUF1102 domain-containing protein n=1 Tax=Haloarcula marismortui ATCC 33799 TaxID=662475 RepID=M0K6E4_9EURY|nr:hypothetical protein C435_14773 [Haloarcula californiae ATCC 33799]